MPELVRLTHEYFQPLIDQSFVASAGDESLALRVTEVRLHAPPKRRTLSGALVDATGARQPFSVFFRSEGERALRQGTYGLTPPGGGEPIRIFIVPLGFEDGGAVYEAVFS